MVVEEAQGFEERLTEIKTKSVVFKNKYLVVYIQSHFNLFNPTKIEQYLLFIYIFLIFLFNKI